MSEWTKNIGKPGMWWGLGYSLGTLWVDFGKFLKKHVDKKIEKEENKAE